MGVTLESVVGFFDFFLDNDKKEETILEWVLSCMAVC